MEASPEKTNKMDFESKGLSTDGKLVLSSPKAPVKSISIHVLTEITGVVQQSGSE